ncbi:MAG: Ribosomal RNA small subunit methyltransferase A [Syntrophaceae bacterium PtaU1.Bin231]|nr:MAG: Ribosomal RNA small subunit methyltransferase A [Syntrophaceae bacterium PtaU1.Bin231]
MKSAREILHSYGIHPRRRYSQSFLEDRAVMERILGLAAIGADETVLEIGSGVGLLTERIAERAARVLAVEIDPSLVEILNRRLGRKGNVEIVSRDILKVDLSEWSGRGNAGKLKVIGNIPYSISSPILFHLLAHRRSISSATVMMQREVADRLTASCGCKEYGIPTVLFAVHASISGGIEVPPSCFFPPPRVHSMVLRFDFAAEPNTPLSDENFFARVVRTSFAMRRKTLFNCLRGSEAAPESDEELRRALDAAGIVGKRRAETLTPEEFGRLSNVLREGRRHAAKR